MENFSAGYSQPSNLLPNDDINTDNNNNNRDNSYNNSNNNNINDDDDDEMKGVTKSLFTDAFFQNVLGFRGTVVSWQPFEVSKFLMRQDTKKRLPPSVL